MLLITLYRITIGSQIMTNNYNDADLTIVDKKKPPLSVII